jgi:hypothetical protein
MEGGIEKTGKRVKGEVRSQKPEFRREEIE